MMPSQVKMTTQARGLLFNGLAGMGESFDVPETSCKCYSFQDFRFLQPTHFCHIYDYEFDHQFDEHGQAETLWPQGYSCASSTKSHKSRWKPSERYTPQAAGTNGMAVEISGVDFCRSLSRTRSPKTFHSLKSRKEEPPGKSL